MTNKSTAKKIEEIRQAIDLHNAEQELRNIKSNASRARSVTAGTSFCGVTELTMRGDAGEILWCPMQPVEVIELIHQLAANIGCHIHIQPRKDFASWRNWKEETAIGMSSRTEAVHPPILNINEHPAHQLALPIRSESNEQTVATQKAVGRKRTKRASAAA